MLIVLAGAVAALAASARTDGSGGYALPRIRPALAFVGSPTRTRANSSDRRHQMSLLPFVLVTTVGAVLALLLRSNERVATAIAVGGLVAAAVTAMTISPGQSVVIGEAGIATTEYLRLFLVLGATVGLLLVVVGEAVGSPRDARAVTLGVLATSALALSLSDARIAVLAATAGGLVGILVTIASPATSPEACVVASRELRALAVAEYPGRSSRHAWIGRPTWQSWGRSARGIRLRLPRIRGCRRDPVRSDPVPLLGGAGSPMRRPR